jgi:lipase chaperone LimK
MRWLGTPRTRVSLGITATGGLLVLGLLFGWLANPDSGLVGIPGASTQGHATPDPAGAQEGDSFTRNPGDANAPMPDDIELQILDVAAWQARGQDPLLNPDLLRIFEQILGRASNASNAPEQLLAGRIPPAHLARAQRLLAQYQRYRDALASRAPLRLPGDSPAAALAEFLEVRQTLQREYFSPDEIAGLLAEDHRYDTFTVARLRTTERNDISLAEKEQRIRQLETDMLSETQREIRHTATLPSRIAQLNARLEQTAAPASERQSARAAEFGETAARRMAELDRREAAWQQRIHQLAQADPATQQQMRATLFSPTERLRLDAALSLYRAQQTQAALP